MLLMLQLLVPIPTTFANPTIGAGHGDSNGRIEVKKVDQSKEAIKWRVVMNASGQENNGIGTKISFSPGLAHGSITEIQSVEIKKTADGYDIKTPAGSEAFELELVTNIKDSKQTIYEVQAIATYTDGEFEASDQTTLPKESSEGSVIKDDDQVAEEEKSTNQNQEKPTTPDQDSSDQKKESNEAGKETEHEKPQIENSAPEEKPKIENAGPEEKDVEQIEGKPHPPFLSTARPSALAGIQSGSEWPAPGSLKLTKDATPTGTYAEWEVELTIEGKNVKTSSDIVLVLDRSGSMSEGRRLLKAKQAANEFVDNLLLEGSSTRIGLVTFSEGARKNQDFSGYSNKQQLKNAINSVWASGGTNIQAGLHQAQTMLAGSNADQKIIVVLSDGEPTYSFRASNASAYSWPGNKYRYILSNFNYSNFIGLGSSYELGWRYSYRVNGYNVETNGIATISEAKHIMNAGVGIYSVGLEVGRNRNATYVLENSQNKGYYLGGQDDLSEIFEDIAAKINYAATDAIVTDPMGEMFNLVKDGSYNGENFTASHGTVKWDDATETFTWNVGDIKEDEIYRLKYKITIDWDKNPQGDVLYPTNGDTPLNYTDPSGKPSTKPFPIPEAGIDKGLIIKKGYRVNVDGQPIDRNGNVVSSPAEAEQFYDVFHEENRSKELKFNQTYSVPANDVPGYTLHVGENPANVRLTAANPKQTVWFGYVKTEELQAGDITVKYVDEDGNPIAEEEILSGKIGETYTTEQKKIPGYEFKEMHQDSAPAEGTFTKEEQTVIYVYKKKLGSLSIKKVDKNDHDKALAGATFELYDANNTLIATKTTGEDGIITFDHLDWGEYTLVETKAPEGYRKLTKPIKVDITKEHLHVEKTVENTQVDWTLPDTGGIGALGFYGLGILLMAGACFWLFFKSARRRTKHKL